ncbi:MAG: hypothetical protein FWC32_08880 [Firmicutes bacterium]|nr:hypothetical protein [Bacillota bacterium]
MPKSRQIVVEAIHYLTYFILFYGIFATIVFLISEDTASLLWAGLMIVPGIIFFLFRQITTRLGVLLALHLVIPVLVAVILPNDIINNTWAAIALALTIHSIIFAYQKKPTEIASFIAPCSIILIIFTFWAVNTGNWVLVPMYPVLLAIIVIGRILLIRMIKMDRSLDAIHMSYKQPIDKIITFDYKLTIGLIVAITGVSLVIYLLLISPVSNVIVNMRREAVELDFEGRGLQETPRPAPSVHINRLFQLEEHPSSPFWDLLSSVVFGVASIGIIAGVLYGLYRILMFLLSYSSHRSKHQTASVSIEDEREFIRPKASKRRSRIRSVLTELHPIRRLFKETARRHVKMGVPIKQSDTPTDMAGRIQSEDISSLAEEYAEVRYKN